MKTLKNELPEGNGDCTVLNVSLEGGNAGLDHVFGVGERALLKRDTAFKQGDCYCLIASGNEVVVAGASSPCCNVYEIKYGNASSVVKGSDLSPAADAEGFRFSVGDKVARKSSPGALCFVSARFVSVCSPVYSIFETSNNGACADVSEDELVPYVKPKAEFRYSVGDKVTAKDGNPFEVFMVISQLNMDGRAKYSLQRFAEYVRIMDEDDLEPYVEKDIKETVKTFKDAFNYCRIHNVALTSQYDDAVNVGLQRCAELFAYIKLRIVTAALNGFCGRESKERFFVLYDSKTKEPVVASSDICLYQNLVFESRDAAEYACSQFRDIYLDFFRL